MLFCPAKVRTIRSYKYILECFGVMVGLSINYDKFVLIPLNCLEVKVIKMKKWLPSGISAY